jgi:hypothetical protein
VVWQRQQFASASSELSLAHLTAASLVSSDPSAHKASRSG